MATKRYPRETKNTVPIFRHEKLDEVMRERGLNNNRLAVMLSAGASRVNDWRTGNRAPSLYYFAALCRLLDLRPEDMVAFENVSLAPRSQDDAALSQLREDMRMLKDQMDRIVQALPKNVK